MLDEQRGLELIHREDVPESVKKAVVCIGMVEEMEEEFGFKPPLLLMKLMLTWINDDEEEYRRLVREHVHGIWPRPPGEEEEKERLYLLILEKLEYDEGEYDEEEHDEGEENEEEEEELDEGEHIGDGSA